MVSDQTIKNRRLQTLKKGENIVKRKDGRWEARYKDRFINAVRKLSEEYEIDADMKEIDAGYVAALYMHCASYSGYMKNS